MSSAPLPRHRLGESAKADRRSYFGIGFRVATGALAALLLVAALISLRPVVFSVGAALFLALGLNPLVRILNRKGFARRRAVAFVGITVAAAVGGLLWLLVPFLISQASSFISALPEAVKGLTSQQWFIRVNEMSEGAAHDALVTLTSVMLRPDVLTGVATGLIGLGAGVAESVTSVIFIAILTLYFLAGLPRIKKGFYALIPASNRRNVIYLGEKIADSVGKYLSGMVILAFLNATYSLILLTVAGVDYALLISIAAFFITLIPLIGTILTTVFMTLIASLTSLPAAIIVLVGMLVYMQVEAYIFTPRVMSQAVQVPGALVVIAATAGGSLLGLPGALVAIPVAAACLLIINRVVVPVRRLQ